MSKMADKHAEMLDAPDEKRLVVEGEPHGPDAWSPEVMCDRIRRFLRSDLTDDERLVVNATLCFVEARLVELDALHDARQELERIRKVLRGYPDSALVSLATTRMARLDYLKKYAPDKEAPGE